MKSYYLTESPEQRALNLLTIAMETGRMEFVKEAYGVLDGHINRNASKQAPFPFQPRTAGEHARAS